MVARLAPAAVVMFGIGLVDDLRGLSPRQKFIGQLVAAVLAIWGGVLVTGFGAWQFPVWVAAPLTVVWVVGCANAFNLIDGVDGLAAGIGSFATVTMLLAALLQNNVALALATVPLAGALLGFLRFNFNPATIFLGDCGSLTIGFLLGCYGVLWSQKSATVLGMTAPLMALAVPLLDTTLSMARRFLRGKPISAADKGHIHHRLLARGMTQRKVTLLLYGAAAFGALLSVLQTSLTDHYAGLVVVLFCAAAWIGVQHLGYVEFGVAGRMFVDGAFRRHFSAQLALGGFEEALKKARSADDCWAAIRDAAKEFGYEHANAKLDGHLYAFGNGGADRNRSWIIRIPLSELEWVNLEHDSNSAVPVSRAGPFADAIQQALRAKLDVMKTPEVPEAGKLWEKEDAHTVAPRELDVVCRGATSNE